MIIHEKHVATELVEVGSGPERSEVRWPSRKNKIDDASVVPSEDSSEADNSDVDEPGKLRRGVVLILLLLPVVLSVAIYAGVQAAAKSRTGQVNKALELNRVRVGVTKVGTIASPELLIRFRGVVAPRRESSLSFRRSGPVQNVFVDSGDHLKAGAMIAELDIADLIAQAELADSELEMAVAQFDEAIVGPGSKRSKPLKLALINCKLSLMPPWLGVLAGTFFSRQTPAGHGAGIDLCCRTEQPCDHAANGRSRAHSANGPGGDSNAWRDGGTCRVVGY